MADSAGNTMGADRCRKGDWVEIERELLQPEDRAANLPPDTAAQPLKMWVKGFAETEAVLGEDVLIETMTRRLVSGRLTDVNPGYTHTFGRPAPELVRVGYDLRNQVAGFHGDTGA
jgi:hypothetical protein